MELLNQQFTDRMDISGSGASGLRAEGTAAAAGKGAAAMQGQPAMAPLSSEEDVEMAQEHVANRDSREWLSGITNREQV
jgi:hypothetical protein